MGAASFVGRSRRRWNAFLSLIFCTGIIGTLKLLSTDDQANLRPLIINLSPNRLLSHQSSLDLTHLYKLDLSPEFSYSRQLIRTKHYNGERLTLNVVNETLFGASHVLNMDNLNEVEVNSSPPLTLYVPSSPKVDASLMSFGIATTIERLPAAIPQLQHWLPHTDVSFFVVVPPDEKAPEVEQEMQNLSINVTIIASDLPFAQAYFSLIKEMYESRSSNTKWLVLIDDDTFIPSLSTLVAHLNKAYDPSEKLLVSATSDNIEQIRTFGLLPFGGGGIFISVSLAAQLLTPSIYEACLLTNNNQGDQLINDCLNDHSSVRPTFDPGLNQMDIHGGGDSTAGFFESGRQMLTIHHWRSWFRVDMPAVALVSKACGDEGVLMRWLFDGNIVLSNGYSIVEYPNGVENVDLNAVEMTWPGEEKLFIHKIGPLRPKLKREEKRTLKMVETIVLKEGIRQTYLERAETVNGIHVEMDRVVELIWLF